MSYFTVSIIGRPNVGKSTLFNALIGERVSIVEPTPGVTRDRVLRRMSHNEKTWDMIDTGGIGIIDNEDLAQEISFQLELSISQADLVLLVVDTQTGMIPDDYRIANELRKANKKILLLANKVDDETQEVKAHDFYSIGLGEPIQISALSYRGIRDLKNLIASLVPAKDETEDLTKDLLKIAVVGRRNAGKSSFINYIAGEERVIVSKHAGTTRDSIDVEIKKGQKHFVIIDTAGMRNKNKHENAIEFFSACRTERAITRANIVLLFLDATETFSAVDGKLGKQIQDEGKSVIIVTTKMDLAKDADRMKYKKYIDHHLPGLDHAPIVFISSKTGENVWKLMDLVFTIHAQSTVEIPTSIINEVLSEAQKKHPHPIVHGVRPRLFYGTQIKFGPPRLLIFARYKKYINQNYIRFLANEFRKRMHTPEISYNFTFRENVRNTKNNEILDNEFNDEEINDLNANDIMEDFNEPFEPETDQGYQV